MSRALLLSVRPVCAGVMTERRLRRFAAVSLMFLQALPSCSTRSPDKAVLGIMCVESLIRSTAAEIWRDYSRSE